MNPVAVTVTRSPTVAVPAGDKVIVAAGMFKFTASVSFPKGAVMGVYGHHLGPTPTLLGTVMEVLKPPRPSVVTTSVVSARVGGEMAHYYRHDAVAHPAFTGDHYVVAHGHSGRLQGYGGLSDGERACSCDTSCS